MRTIALARLFQALAVAFVVGGLSFALMKVLPGDPAMRIAASRYGPDGMTAAAAQLVREELRLDRPVLEQFGGWMLQLARFDLGRSLVTGEAVAEELRIQLGQSIWLAATALVLSLLMGPVVGIAAGLRARSGFDLGALAAAVAIRSVPPFVLAVALMLVFSVWLGWLPPGGFGTWREILLPALTLALGLAAVSSRVTRDSVFAVSRAPYFAFGRTKGLSGRDLVLRHGLRNAAVPVVAYHGLQLVYLIEGIVVVESVFAFPGIGHALVHAIIARDIPMVQGTALVMGLIFVALSLAVDAASAMLDPRLGRGR